MSTVTTAVLAASGFGTRFFPLTKTTQKEMVPVLHRPVIDYLVADLVAAGVTRIIIQIKSASDSITHFFSEDPDMEADFASRGWASKYEAVKNRYPGVEFILLVRDPSEGYGTALPVKQAGPHLGDSEAFFYATADDMVYAPGSSIFSQLQEEWLKADKPDAVLAAREVPAEEVSRYGVFETVPKQVGGATVEVLQQMLEKPAPGVTTSRLVNVSKYLFTGKILPHVLAITPDPRLGEYLVTDAIATLASEGTVAVLRANGEYLDCGNPKSWLLANLRVAMDDPELKAAIVNYIHEHN
jgi:UTP--glucose-1-phosphate uridylyltransferase